MLFTRLQSHAQSTFAAGINRHTNDTAWSRAFGSIGKGKVSGVRTTKAHRHTEALGVTQSHVGTHVSWRFQQYQAHHIGSHSHAGAFGFQAGNHVGQINHVTVFAHVLQQSTVVFAVLGLSQVTNDQFKTEVFGAGLHHVQSLWEHASVHKIAV